MSAWKEAPAEVISMAEKLIDEFHPDLDGANIAILIKSDDKFKLKSHQKWAVASKIPAKFQALLDFDFMIWIQEEIWRLLGEDGKRALLDHELSHCSFDTNDEAVIIPHDFEEFSVIIERHGLWRKSLVHMGEAVNKYLQNPLFKPDTTIEFKSGGRVTTLSGEKLAAWASQRAL